MAEGNGAQSDGRPVSPYRALSGENSQVFLGETCLCRGRYRVYLRDSFCVFITTGAQPPAPGHSGSQGIELHWSCVFELRTEGLQTHTHTHTHTPMESHGGHGACVHACVRVCVHECVCVHRRECVFFRVPVCEFLCTCVCINVCLCSSVCVRMACVQVHRREHTCVFFRVPVCV